MCKYDVSQGVFDNKFFFLSIKSQCHHNNLRWNVIAERDTYGSIGRTACKPLPKGTNDNAGLFEPKYRAIPPIAIVIDKIDRKIALDDIALAKGLDISELLDEIEAIVYSGTKINIDYFINNIMDKDHQQDIYDYFMEDAENESVEDALKELGEDNYTEEEVRLMRIKFLSELGN